MSTMVLNSNFWNVRGIMKIHVSCKVSEAQKFMSPAK